jgi:hypothetical protein
MNTKKNIYANIFIILQKKMEICEGCCKAMDGMLITDCCKKLKCVECASVCDMTCHHWLCCFRDVKLDTCFGCCPENHFENQDLVLRTDLFEDEEDHDHQRKKALDLFDESLGNLQNLTCLQKLLVSEFEDVNDGHLELRCVNPFKKKLHVESKKFFSLVNNVCMK